MQTIIHSHTHTHTHTHTRTHIHTHRAQQVGISMAQIIASANSVYEVPWPQVFSDFLDIMKLFLVDVVTLTRAQCAAYMTYFSSLVLVLLLFKVVVALVLLFAWAVPAARRYLRTRRSKSAVPKVARSGSARTRVVSGRRRSVVMRLQTTDWVKVRGPVV